MEKNNSVFGMLVFDSGRFLDNLSITISKLLNNPILCVILCFKHEFQCTIGQSRNLAEQNNNSVTKHFRHLVSSAKISLTTGIIY